MERIRELCSSDEPATWLGAGEFFDDEIAELLPDRRANTRPLLVGLFGELGPAWSRIARDKLLEKIGKGPVFKPSAYLVRIAQEKLELAEGKRCSA